MNKSIKHSITVNNKKYFYALAPHGKGATFVTCEAANVAQDFLNEDIPGFLHDLPNLILAEKKYKIDQSELIRFRVSSSDKKKIERYAVKVGYSSVSSYLRDIALNKMRVQSS